MKISKLGISTILSLSLLGCVDGFAGVDEGIDDSEIDSTSAAVSTPVPLEFFNSCDQSPVRILASSTTPNKFSLDPGNGTSRFRGKLRRTRPACAVGVKFNVPAGFKARFGIGTTVGTYTTGTTADGISNRAGFTTLRPIDVEELQLGPSKIDDQFLPKSSSGSFDLQVDGNDEEGARLFVTECGQQGTWIYIRPSISTPGTNVDLSLILANFKLEAC